MNLKLDVIILLLSYKIHIEINILLVLFWSEINDVYLDGISNIWNSSKRENKKRKTRLYYIMRLQSHQIRVLLFIRRHDEKSIASRFLLFTLC